MSESFKVPDELNELERQLAALSPRASRLDRDRVMYLAGRAAAETELGTGGAAAWLWPSATGVMTAVSVLLAMMLVLGDRPGVAKRDVPDRESELAGDATPPSQGTVVAQDDASRQSPTENASDPPVPAIAADVPGSVRERSGLLAYPSFSASEAGYVHLRNVALRMGTEAMGQTHRAAGGPQPTYWELTSALGKDATEVPTPPDPIEGEPQSGVEILPDFLGATAHLAQQCFS
jgi:hypothetical protein